MPYIFEHLPDETKKRFVAILNKKVELGRLMNALGHMTAGLAGGGRVTTEEMCFLEYRDQDGGVHPTTSHYPFIVLQADNSNQIRTVRHEALRRDIPFVDFTNTMIVGTSREQVERTAATPEAGLDYYGICLFGNTDELNECTKKFSLFRGAAS